MCDFSLQSTADKQMYSLAYAPPLQPTTHSRLHYVTMCLCRHMQLSIQL